MDGSDRPLITLEQWQRVLRTVKTRPDLLFDLAMVLEGRADTATLESTLASYQLLPSDMPMLEESSITGPQLKALREDIREHGLGFRRKAAAMAEAYLPRVATIVNDPDTPPQVRLSGIGQLAKWGGLEKTASADVASGVTVNIQFNTGERPIKVISHHE